MFKNPVSSKLYFSTEGNLQESELTECFAQFGKIRSLYLCDRYKKGSFVYGFVHFFSLEAAKEAIRTGLISCREAVIKVKTTTQKNQSGSKNTRNMPLILPEIRKEVQTESASWRKAYYLE